MTRLVMPWPPALNRYYRHVNGRVLLSREGQQYRANATAAIIEQGRPRLTGRIACVIEVHQPDRRQRDLDGMLKAALDALEFAQVLRNDGDIDSLRVERASVDRERPRLEVTLRTL